MLSKFNLLLQNVAKKASWQGVELGEAIIFLNLKKIKILYNFFIENIIDRYGIDIQWIRNFRRPEWIFV